MPKANDHGRNRKVSYRNETRTLLGIAGATCSLYFRCGFYRGNDVRGPVSFGPITTPTRIRRISVYDMEWVPGTLEMRLVGLYDGNTYRSYLTVESFLRVVLTSANRGRWFFAHAGGLYDVQFILDCLVASGRYQVQAKFSGSSAIMVDVAQGKNVWHFFDSYWLLRDSLKNIGKSVGIAKTGPKGGADTDGLTDERVKEWYRSVPLAELREYNYYDCVILHTAIDNLETELLHMGSQLQPTVAASAMQLFRRSYMSRKIPTNGPVNESARKAYFASRVEVFNTSCDDAYYYDINSSFPYAMTKKQPGKLLATRNHLYDYLLPDNGPPFMAWVDFEVPDTYFPPMPYRHPKGRVFFPTGRWQSWLSGIDIRLLIREGAKIYKAREVLEFEPFWDLAAYANDLFDKRRKSTDEFQRLVLKFQLNSLYGKFGESSEKQTVHINPSAKILKRLGWENLLMPGVWVETVDRPVPHMHVPLSVSITAQARLTLYDYMRESSEFHYCDTDGFSTTDAYPVGTALGDLKLEKKILNGRFVAPKVYRLLMSTKGKDGWSEPEIMVKAKGFSLGKGDRAISKFTDLLAGKQIEVDRMMRIRENFKRGVTKPYERVVRKRLTDNAITKRFHYPDGESRPWHISELDTI